MTGVFTGWAPGRRFGFIRTGGPGIDSRAPDFIFLPSALRTAILPGDVVDFWIGAEARSAGEHDVAVDISRRGAAVDPAERIFVGNVPAVCNGRLRRALEENIGPVIQIFRQQEWDHCFVDFAGADAKRAASGTVRVEIDGAELRFQECLKR